MTKEAAKRSTKRIGREEDGHTETTFMSAILEGDVEDDTGENATFGKAKNGANNEETTDVFTMPIKVTPKNRAPMTKRKRRKGQTYKDLWPR
jgi:hypothetical protein